MECVDYRVENLPQEVIDARDEHILAMVEQEEAVVIRDEWLGKHGGFLAGLRAERKAINDRGKERDLNNKFVLSSIERKELTIESKTLTEQVSVLVKARQELDDDVTANNLLAQSKKRATDKLRSGCSYHTDIRMIVEKCLCDNLINCAKYHGGQLEGTTVMKLFQKANGIFESIKQSLIDVPEKACDDNAVIDMIERYVELCTLFDCLFSKARTPSGEATNEICDLTEKYVTVVMVKWRDLRLSTDMLKIHGIEDHLVKQMRDFNGIGCFLEDFVEQAHQFGMRDEKRTTNMPDRKRKYNSHSSNEVASLNAEVIAHKEVVSNKSKRKMKRRIGEERREAKQKVKEENGEYCFERVVLAPNPIDDFRTKLTRN